MLPYKTIIQLEKGSRIPLYLQITNVFIKNISAGTIKAGLKLPGSRILSNLLKINRRTVISAYEELEAQGWVVVRPNKGSYVSSSIPVLKAKDLGTAFPIPNSSKTYFHLPKNIEKKSNLKLTPKRASIIINDGYPDVRLAPLKELGKNISYIMSRNATAKLMNYNQSFTGDRKLKEEVLKYLAETRSINTEPENILITRGSQMAFYLLFQTILKTGDYVIVGSPGFNEGYTTIEAAGGKPIRIAVDENGMDMDEVEKICAKKKIKAVFIIPHHHYPTTVSLSASRRMKLLILAEKYGFAIIEDDYDYDFHYSSSPILPIASSDRIGAVAYVGSFSKTIAPSLRMGYVIGPKNLILNLTELCKKIDSFGNTAVERSVAMLIESGEMRRHLKKATKIYRHRRDHLCRLLQDELGSFLDFKIPEGGLAVWASLAKEVDLIKIQEIAYSIGLFIPDGSSYSAPDTKPNAIRIGFASMDDSEIEKSIGLLSETFKRI